VQISPEKRKTHRHANILSDVNSNGKQGAQEIAFGSMKKRKQLEELWLKPVISLDTSLEEAVDEDGH
jgi:hypothetical protein